MMLVIEILCQLVFMIAWLFFFCFVVTAGSLLLFIYILAKISDLSDWILSIFKER